MLRALVAACLLVAAAVPASASDDGACTDALGIQSLSSSSVRITWTEVPDATGYRVVTQRDSEDPVAHDPPLPPGTTRTTLDGLQGGVWEFRVHALSEGGTLATFCAQTHLHEEHGCVDGFVQAGVEADGRVRISWSSYPGATAYTATVEKIGGSPQTLPPFGPDVSGFHIEETEPGQTYIVTVHATTSSGPTVEFCAVSATVPAEVPFFAGFAAVALAALGLVGAAVLLRRRP